MAQDARNVGGPAFPRLTTKTASAGILAALKLATPGRI